MIYRLSKPFRQATAIGLALIVAALAIVFAIIPLMAPETDVQEAIDRERSILGKLQSMVNEKASLQEDDQRADTARKSGIFIQGASEAIRLAAVQSQISQILAANGVKPRLTRGLPGRDRDDLHLVGAQVQILAPIGKVQKILLDIEGHQPALLIDYLQITPSSLAGMANDDEAGALDARFDVYAVALREKSE